MGSAAWSKRSSTSSAGRRRGRRGGKRDPRKVRKRDAVVKRIASRVRRLGASSGTDADRVAGLATSVGAPKASATANGVSANDRKSPSTDRKPPSTDRKLPSTDRKPPSTDRKLPSNRSQSSDDRSELPAGSRKRSATDRYRDPRARRYNRAPRMSGAAPESLRRRADITVAPIGTTMRSPEYRRRSLHQSFDFRKPSAVAGIDSPSARQPEAEWRRHAEDRNARCRRVSAGASKYASGAPSVRESRPNARAHGRKDGRFARCSRRSAAIQIGGRGAIVRHARRGVVTPRRGVEHGEEEECGGVKVSAGFEEDLLTRGEGSPVPAKQVFSWNEQDRQVQAALHPDQDLKADSCSHWPLREADQDP